MTLEDLFNSITKIHFVLFVFLFGYSFLLFFVYIGLKKKLLNRKNVLAYICLRATFWAIALFSWGFFVQNLLHEYVKGLGANWKELSSPVATAFGFFFLFFATFFINTGKSFVLRGLLLQHRLKKSIVKRIAFFLYALLMLWFFFLLACSFIPTSDKNMQQNIQNVLAIGTVLCFIGMGAYLLHILSSDYNKQQKKHGNVTGLILVRAVSWPAIYLLFGCGIIYIVTSIFGTALLGEKNIKSTYGLVFGSSMLFAAFRITSSIELYFLSREQEEGVVASKAFIQGVGSTGRIILGLMFFMLVWNFFVGGEGGISTALGGIGLGIAFAARPIISDYLSGVMLYLESNFRIGDWIYFTDKKIEGTIECVGPRITSIRTFDKRLLYVPNTLISSASVVNASRMTHRRVLEKIPIGWITSLSVLDCIIQEIRLMVSSHPGIDKTQTLMVHFTGFGGKGLEITIYAFTKTRDWHTSLNVCEHILRESKSIIEKHAGAPPAEVSYRLSIPQEKEGI